MICSKNFFHKMLKFDFLLFRFFYLSDFFKVPNYNVIITGTRYNNRRKLLSPDRQNNTFIHHLTTEIIYLLRPKKILLFPETRPTLIFRPDPKVFIGLS